MRRGVRARSRFERRVGEIVAVLLVGAASAGLGLITTAVPGTASAGARPASTVPGPVNLTLAIAPGTWTMMASSSAVFTASVDGAPVGCTAIGLQATWWLAGESALTGILNRSSGDSVTYTTFASETGGLGFLSVDGSVTLDCGGTLEGDAASGSAEVTVLPTAVLSGPYVTPDPATPGAPTLVSWRIAGGLPPYQVAVEFGDGELSTLTQAASGPDELVHRYPAGTFTPSVSATDSQGHLVVGTIAAPATVAAGLVALIGGAGPQVDAGRPFELTANASGGVPPYSYYWKGAGAPEFGTTWTRVVPTRGTFNASLEVVDLVGDTAEASVALTVVAPPSVSVAVPSVGCDVGVPFPLRVNASGGTAPYRIAWDLSPGTSGTNATLPAPGSFVEPATARTSGGGWVSVTLVDALGANTSAASPIPGVHAVPVAQLTATGSMAETGVPLGTSATVLGGTAPFRWTILPSAPVAAPTSDTGLSADGGPFVWSGTPETTGVLTLEASVVDADGMESTANATVRIVSALAPIVEVATSGISAGRAATIGLLLQGGSPPFQYAWATSDGQSGWGNASAPGPIDLSIAPRSAGFWTLQVAVTDALGVTANESTDALVSPTAPAPSAAPDTGAASPVESSWPLVLLAAVAAGVAGWIARQRTAGSRPPSPDPPADGAMGVVRRLLEESGELEQETLTFLAEEEGVAPDASLAAVERWQRARRITSRTGEEGETLYRWTGPSGASSGPSRSEGR